MSHSFELKAFFDSNRLVTVQFGSLISLFADVGAIILTLEAVVHFQLAWSLVIRSICLWTFLVAWQYLFACRAHFWKSSHLRRTIVCQNAYCTDVGL